MGYVFADAAGVIDGACACHHDASEWRLQWVWVRPARRRRGLLAARWGAFLIEFGDFWIETPLSRAMKRFVVRHVSRRQRQLLAARDPHALLNDPDEQPA